jgi:hypothetical protein
MENIYSKPIFFGLVGITTMIMTYATLNQTATNVEPLINTMKPIDNNQSNINIFSNEPEQQRNEPNFMGGKRNKTKCDKKIKHKKTKRKNNK